MTGQERLHILSTYLRSLGGHIADPTQPSPTAVPMPLDREEVNELPVPGNFSLTTWHCGSTACAVGHACFVPELAAEGLKMAPTAIGWLLPYFEGEWSWRAVQDFFELSEPTTQWLFMDDSYGHQDRENPIAVADRIDEYLEQEKWSRRG